MADKQKNVFGEDIKLCSSSPLTGFFRDGCCNTDSTDLGAVSYTHLTLPTKA